MGDASSGTLANLQVARDACLNTPPYYLQIAPAVINNVAGAASLELRRWAAEFFAEMFSSPVLAADAKQHLSLGVMDLLKEYLETAKQDTGILKNTIQTITSIYPFVYRHVIRNPKDGQTWEKMAAMKRFILTKMDTLPVGVNICCVKFVQRVVQLQTEGMITDPRRPDQNDLSLSLIPPDHPLLDKQRLGAEATGLLDRLLDYLKEPYDAIMITSTLNSIGVLVRTRPALTDRIKNAILRFNPFRLKTQGINPRVKVLIKSMERTIRAFLVNWNKRAQGTPESGWIQSYLAWLEQTRKDFQEESRKRPAPTDTPDNIESAKRPRIAITDTPPIRPSVPPVPPLPVPLAALFTLTSNPALTSFNTRQVPPLMLFNILEPLARLINPNHFERAVNDVRAKYLAIQGAVQGNAVPPPPNPPQYQAPMPERGPPQAVARPRESMVQPMQDIPIGPYIIPQPRPMSKDDVEESSRATLGRIFGLIRNAPGAPSDAPEASGAKPGFYRLAASNQDRKSWITLSIRMATRLAGNASEDPMIKPETNGPNTPFSAPDLIREALRIYILEDFRTRIDTAISWLTEEWYAERLHTNTTSTYQKWTLKILEGIAPYIAPKDKQILILMSEIPELTPKMVEWVKKLAGDPERAALAVRLLQYLVLTRVPVREMCLDAMEELCRKDERLKGLTEKTLKGHRPEFVKALHAKDEDQEQLEQQPGEQPPASQMTTAT